MSHVLEGIKRAISRKLVKISDCPVSRHVDFGFASASNSFDYTQCTFLKKKHHLTGSPYDFASLRKKETL